MRYIHFSLVMVLMILVSACANKKSQTTDHDEVKEMVEKKTDVVKLSKADLEAILATLVGSWQWDKTVCCSRMPNTTSAENTKKDIVIKFTEDYKAESYGKGELVKTVDFELAMMDRDRPTIKFSDVSYPAILTFNADTLIVDYGYMDLQVEYYTRKD